MAHQQLHSFRNQLPFLDIDQNMDFLTHLSDLTSVTSSLNFQNPAVLSGNHLFPDMFLSDSFPPVDLQQNRDGTDVLNVEQQRKRKAVEISGSRFCDDPSVCDSKKKSSGCAKKKKNVDEKPKEVVHVRARRGQATDSHSLAERVRRGKINERLKCLQDIVPGCYKTMGMALMLDEIINYVQSLQNQVEFLSMKLTAASSLYDFNSESDSIDRMQRAMAGEMERRMRNGDGYFQPTWHP